ncbi:MAG: hypothetical protein HUK20_12280 [Fibrobacter sp.]|nr:hypothetical protein [Fibrobacter sp.]
MSIKIATFTIALATAFAITACSDNSSSISAPSYEKTSTSDSTVTTDKQNKPDETNPNETESYVDKFINDKVIPSNKELAATKVSCTVQATDSSFSFEMTNGYFAEIRNYIFDNETGHITSRQESSYVVEDDSKRELHHLGASLNYNNTDKEIFNTMKSMYQDFCKDNDGKKTEIAEKSYDDFENSLREYLSQKLKPRTAASSSSSSSDK